MAEQTTDFLTVKDVLKEAKKPRPPSPEEIAEKTRISGVDQALRDLVGNKKLRQTLQDRRQDNKEDYLNLARDGERRRILSITSSGALQSFHPSVDGKRFMTNLYELVNVRRPIKREGRTELASQPFKLEDSAIKTHRNYIKGGRTFVCTYAEYGKVGEFLVDILRKESFSGLNKLTSEEIQKTAAVELKGMLSR